MPKTFHPCLLRTLCPAANARGKSLRNLDKVSATTRDVLTWVLHASQACLEGAIRVRFQQQRGEELLVSLIGAAHREHLLFLLLPPVAGYPRHCAWHGGLPQGGNLDAQEILVLRCDGQ